MSFPVADDKNDEISKSIWRYWQRQNGDFLKINGTHASTFMFFKNRSGASRLMKTVIFGVVPRGPGDPLVSPGERRRAPEGPGREVTRAEGPLGDKGG